MQIPCAAVHALLLMFATQLLLFFSSPRIQAQDLADNDCHNWFWQASIQVRCNFSRTMTSITLGQSLQMSTTKILRYF